MPVYRQKMHVVAHSSFVYTVCRGNCIGAGNNLSIKLIMYEPVVDAGVGDFIINTRILYY